MGALTEKKIEELQKRWEGKNELITELTRILKGDGRATNVLEARNRITKVNELLKSSGISNRYAGQPTHLKCFKEQDLRAPVLDLRGIDLAGKDCSDIILGGVHLEGSNLCMTYLEDAWLQKAHLEFADLSSAYMNRINLEFANLEQAILSSAKLINANLNQVNLNNANLNDGRLNGAQLRFANLDKANLYNAYLEGSDLLGVQFKEANLVLAHLHGADLTGANLTEADLSASDIRDVNFFRANLSCAKLVSVEWKPFRSFSIKPTPPDTKFQRTRIIGTDFTNSRVLERYIKDNQWLEEVLSRLGKKKAVQSEFEIMLDIRKKSYWLKILHFVWGWISDYGRSFSRLSICCVFFILVFACLYCIGRIEIPSLFPSWLAIDQPILQFEKEFNINHPFWESLWFSFDIFTNLGVRRVHPINIPAYIAVFLETVLGFIALAALISVMLDKFARRS